jgi:hypothetical protein
MRTRATQGDPELNPATAETLSQPRIVSPRRRTFGGSPAVRFGYIAVSSALALALAVGLWSVPTVRTVLQQSFTRMPAVYTEMYFTATPTLDGALLSAPIKVVGHHTSAASFRLSVWLTTNSGAAEDKTTVNVPAADGTATTAIKLTVPTDADVVWIALAGSSDSLHYRIGGTAIPVPSAK